MLLLVALNARYYHTGLAARCLLNACRASGTDAQLLECGINDPVDDIVRLIVASGADTVGFSCYIWNIEYVGRLCALIKLVRPDTRIILGGPEVSFDAEWYLEQIPQSDAVLCGEGEELLPAYLAGRRDMAGLALRTGGGIVVTPGAGIYEGFADAPFQYSDTELSDHSRIFYIETSRGCPFSCAYCLSGRQGGVRFRPLEAALNDIDRFIDAGVPLLKYVDRTFNCDESRARAIYSHIMAKGGATQHHFEICGHLITQETLELLSHAPKGLFRFEIGVQTTDPHALDEVGRVTNTAKLFENVRALTAQGRIELHLDLIAGLPGESFCDIAKSFDEVYALGADMLQLGFLKLLRGSAVRDMAARYGYAFSPAPPYEVLKNDTLSYEELCDIKLVAFALDRFVNSGSAPLSVRYITGDGSPFLALLGIGRLWRDNGSRPLSREGAMALLYKCGQRIGRDAMVLKELLRYDYLKKDRHIGAAWLKNKLDADQRKRLHDAVRSAGGKAYGDMFFVDVDSYEKDGAIIMGEHCKIFS